MPVQGSYDVNSAEDGVRAASGRSYSRGAWISLLIGFFVCCAVILIVCLIWWPSPKMGHDAELVGGAPTGGSHGSNAAYKVAGNPDDDRGHNPTGGSGTKTNAGPTVATSANQTDKLSSPISVTTTPSTSNMKEEVDVDQNNGRKSVLPILETPIPPTSTREKEVDDDPASKTPASPATPTSEIPIPTTSGEKQNVDDDPASQIPASTATPTSEIPIPTTSGEKQNVDDDPASKIPASTATPTSEIPIPTTSGEKQNVDDDPASQIPASTATPTSEIPIPTTSGEKQNVDDDPASKIPASTATPTSEIPIPTTSGEKQNVDDDPASKIPASTATPTSEIPIPTTSGEKQNVDDDPASQIPASTATPTSEIPIPTTSGEKQNVDDDPASKIPASTATPTSEIPIPTTSGEKQNVDDDPASKIPASTATPTSEIPIPTTSGEKQNVDDDPASKIPASTATPTSEIPIPTTSGEKQNVDDDPASKIPASTATPTSEIPIPTTSGEKQNVDDDTASQIPASTATPTSELPIPTTSGEKQNVDDDPASKIPASTATDPSIPKSGNIMKEEPNVGNQIASQMLFYMNHTADACDDFYEYACGGFEASHLMSENDLEKQATKRIFAQAKKSESSTESRQFLDYHQSCLEHNNRNESQKIELVKQAVNQVGNFNAEADWLDKNFDLTPLLSKLLLHNSAPLFDITLDVAVNVQESCSGQSDPPNNKFTFRIGPPVRQNTLYTNHEESDCYNEQKAAMSETEFDSGKIYENYKDCTSNSKPIVDAVKNALTVFTDVTEDDVNAAIIAVEYDLFAKFSQKYPSQGDIRKAYLTEDYTLMTIKELQGEIEESFFSWTLLLETLTGSTPKLEQHLQVYFPNIIRAGIEYLESKQYTSPINNALLALYAHQIYNELVTPPRDVENYCERATTTLLRTHASSLYLSSFSSEELEYMNETTKKMFEELKTTLELNVQEAPWLKHNTAIMKKIDDLDIELPDISYYQGENKLNVEKSGIQDAFTRNFVDDTIMMQMEYRKSMYEMLEKPPSQQIWTHFALPYQTRGSAIYGLNKIIMPYGAVDWSIVTTARKISLPYLVQATLGTKIAQQIAHHFDPTGINHLAVFCNDNDAAKTYQTIIDDYYNKTEGHQIFLPPTNQNTSYKISDVSLNERFSEVTGLQLAYNTMWRLPPNDDQLLPWLNSQDTNRNKQFFLAYAQMYCTKVPLTSNFVSLYENEHLPNRLRISEAVTGNNVFVDTWECGVDTRVRPEVVTNKVFPNLDPDQ